MRQHLLTLAVCAWLLGAATLAAQTTSAPQSIETESASQLIAHLEHGEFSPRLGTRLVVLRAEEAMPNLERAYDRSAAKFEKQSLAAAAVALGDKDRRFLDYLIGFAKPVAESTMPFPYLLSATEKAAPQSYRSNRAFMEWCDRVKMDPDAAAGRAFNWRVSQR